MKSSSQCHSDASVYRHVVLAVIFALTVVGCASAPSHIKMESRTVASQLGLPHCRVSVPLSQTEVVENAKRDGNPHPEQNHEWIEIAANLQPGDTLRLVKCENSSDPYFYALFRKDRVISKFHSMFFD